MTNKISDPVESPTPASRVRTWLSAAAQAVILGVLLFGSAGRLDLPLFWAYLLVHWVLILAGGMFMMKRQPELIQERHRSGPGAKEKLEVLAIVHVGTSLAIIVVAGLDVGRFQWSGQIPLSACVAALIAVSGATAITVSAVIFNPFVSSVIRLPMDRGHYVVSVGPYRWVRHPMYLGSVLHGLVTAIALGSWWAILPGVPHIVCVIWRTSREDRFLHAELDGYAEYSQRVRYRLLPWIW